MGLRQTFPSRFPGRKEGEKGKEGEGEEEEQEKEKKKEEEEEMKEEEEESTVSETFSRKKNKRRENKIRNGDEKTGRWKTEMGGDKKEGCYGRMLGRGQQQLLRGP